MPDMLFLLRRLVGTLASIEVELQSVEVAPLRVIRRPAGASVISAAEAVFGKGRGPLRSSAARMSGGRAAECG